MQWLCDAPAGRPWSLQCGMQSPVLAGPRYLVEG